jgi:hypothetical protein
MSGWGAAAVRAGVGFAKKARKLAEALESHDEGVFGEVGASRAQDAGCLCHSAVAEVGGGAMTEEFCETAPDVGRALARGGGEFG